MTRNGKESTLLRQPHPRGLSLLATLFLLCRVLPSAYPQDAEANVYHVAQTSPNADDGNPGTQAQPWRTIGRAASVARAGDTVLVHEGVYREQVALTHSGQPDRPITFCADKGKVVVTGSDPVTGWVPHSGNVHRATIDWWAPEGWMKCKGKAGNWDGIGGRDTDEVFENGKPLRETAHIPNKPGQFSYDHETNTVYVWCSDSTDPKTKTIEAVRRGGCLLIRGSHIHVEGFVLKNAALRIAYIKGGDRNVVSDCVLQYSAADSGIHLASGADHNLVKNSRISHVGYTGVQISRSSNHNRIEGNEISYCCTEGIIIQSGYFGGVGHQFVGNTIHHVLNEDGIDLKCGHNHLVKGNVIYQCSNLGVQIFNHHGDPATKFKYHRHNKALIEDNVIFANGGGGIYVFEGEYEITNNVIYGNGHEEPYGDRWGGKVHQKPGGYAIEIGPCFEIDGRPLKQRIYNNTCYHNARGEIWIGGPWRAAPQHCVVKNNILVGGLEGVLLKVNQIGTAHLESDYNAMWIGPGGAFAEWECVRDKSLGSSSRSFMGMKHTTFAAYRAATGMDEHSLRVRPDFVNAARHDFTLRPGSPLLGRGTDVGLPSNGNAPTIGARPFVRD